MNIVLLGHRDYASLYALNRIVSSAPKHLYKVFLSGPMQDRSGAPVQLLELEAYDDALTEALLEHPDTDPLVLDSVKGDRHLLSPNAAEGLGLLAAAAPDLIISVRYRRILREAAIAVPRLGVLNLHSGILPDYRGVMATFWAMLAGEAEIGTTLHRIVDSGIDTGPVIEINRQATRIDSSYMDNLISLYDPGCDAILRAVSQLRRGIEPESTEQIAGSGAYYSTPGADQLDSFTANGLILFCNKT